MPNADTVFEGHVRFDRAVLPSRRNGPWRRHCRTITLADFVDADTSEEVSLATDDDGVAFPANARPLSVMVDLDEVVAGGTISACTLQVGDAADPDELFTATSVFTGATLGRLYAPGVYTVLTLEAAYAPIATLTFTGGNSNTATTGRMKVMIDYWCPEAIP